MSSPFTTYSASFREDIARGFKEDVERYSKIRGRLAEFVPSDMQNPDYKALLGPRLDYYLWWRDCADGGTLLAADSGYAWLRCTELINSPGDRTEVLKAIVRFTKACSRSMRLAPMVCGLAEEYALAFGLPLDEIPREAPFAESSVLDTWDLTRYPMRRPRAGALLDPSLIKWTKYVQIPDETMEDIVFMSLRGMDELCRSTKGCGVVRASEPAIGTATIRPFQKFSCFSPVDAVRMPVASTSEGGFRDLLDAIVRHAVRLLAPGVKGLPSVPRTFPNEYRKIVASAVDAAKGAVAWDEGRFRAPLLYGEGFWKDDDIEVAAEDGTSPPVIRPVVFPEIGPLEIGTRLLDSNWDAESDSEERFISSGRLRTSYNEMSFLQKAFYVSWRTKARRGRYGDTDAGYLWLYCTELINHDYDPRAVQDELERAMEAYYDSFPAPISLCRAVADHAMLHGFDVPATPLNECDEAVICSKLESDPVGSITPGAALYLCPDLPERYIEGSHTVYTDALTAATRAVDDVLRKDEGVRLMDLVDKADPFLFRKTLYSGLWHPSPPSFDSYVSFFRESRRASEMLDCTVRTAVCMINRRLGRQGPKIPQRFERRFVDAISKAVSGVFDDMDRRRRREDMLREVSKLSLDRDAVRTAEDDLDAVTGMMASDDPGDVEENAAPAPAPRSEDGDPWVLFSASLTDIERGYLSSVLRGGSEAFLRERRLLRTSVEAAVNEKSMDSVGDVVVEEGTVYDDYIEDLKKVLL